MLENNNTKFVDNKVFKKLENCNLNKVVDIFALIGKKVRSNNHNTLPKYLNMEIELIA